MGLREEWERQVKIAVNEGLQIGVTQLRAASPKGVSPDGESLATAWAIEPAEITAGEISAAIINPLDNATERSAGRGPGPVKITSNLERWAAVKGLSPYAVANSIRERGTRRFRGEEPNTVGIDRDGEIIDDGSAASQLGDIVASQINSIRL